MKSFSSLHLLTIVISLFASIAAKANTGDLMDYLANGYCIASPLDISDVDLRSSDNTCGADNIVLKRFKITNHNQQNPDIVKSGLYETEIPTISKYDAEGAEMVTIPTVALPLLTISAQAITNFADGLSACSHLKSELEAIYQVPSNFCR